MDDESGATDLGDAGQVRLCSSILDTLFHHVEVSINQVRVEQYSNACLQILLIVAD